MVNQQSAHKLALSVIVPGLNEENNIRLAVQDLISTLQNAGLDWEIIIVNDGSTDRTGDIAESLAARESRIRVLHHATPDGVGRSLLDGIHASSKPVVTWTPADGENDSHELIKYLPLIEHVDIVIPFVINKRIRPLLRRVLSAIYLTIINTAFGMRFNYTNGNIIYRKDVFDVIHPRSKGFLVHAECLLKATRSGFIFAEVPVMLKKRTEGDSKAVLLKSFLSVCREFTNLFLEMNFINPLRRFRG